MRGYELLEKMELIDPAFVEAADAPPVKRKNIWVKWGATAACFCLAAAAALMLPGRAATPVPPMEDPTPSGTTVSEGTAPTEEAPAGPVSLYYNDVNDWLSASSANYQQDRSRAYLPGYFTEDLSDQELGAILPPGQDMDISGVAGFDGEGRLLEIFLRIDAPQWTHPLLMAFSSDGTGSCYELPEEPVVSTVNGMEFTVYQLAVLLRASGDSHDYILNAWGELGGWSVSVMYSTTEAQLEQAKAELGEILLWLSSYDDGKPDFAAVTPERIPEYFDRKLSLTEAQSDPDFGAYMLRELPNGFSEESIRRHRDQNSDYLSGLWTQGLDSLSWKVSAYGEQDEARLTGIGQPENYDLSLYPIPRADSVPENLREIVDNPIFDAGELTLEAVYRRAYKVSDAGDTDGWRMRFSVRYGNVLVEISTKGVEPEWVYRQLMELLEA